MSYAEAVEHLKTHNTDQQTVEVQNTSTVTRVKETVSSIQPTLVDTNQCSADSFNANFPSLPTNRAYASSTSTATTDQAYNFPNLQRPVIIPSYGIKFSKPQLINNPKVSQTHSTSNPQH